MTFEYPRWKPYDGYTSYEYLDAGVDYEPFDLVDAVSPFDANPVELSADESARVERLLGERITIAPHEHPIKHPPGESMDEVFDYVKAGRIHTHYEGLSRTPLDAVFDGLLHGLEMTVSKRGFKWDDVVYDLGSRLADVHHAELLVQGTSVADIHRAHETDKIAWFPALEAATPIENELDRIDLLYGLGIRMMGLTYNESNALGTGAKEADDGGLTAFGRAAVARMNKLGMVIGLSHESEATMLAACEATDDPVVLSHTAARGVWNTRRAQPDHVFEAVAETGGVIAIEGAHSTRIEGVEGHTLEGMMAHFEYVVDLVGIDHVTFATDTIYGAHERLMEECAELFSLDEVFARPSEGSFKPSPSHTHVIGNENPTEAWNNIPRWLVKAGYSDEDIAKVTGENTLRVLEAVFGQ